MRFNRLFYSMIFVVFMLWITSGCTLSTPVRTLTTLPPSPASNVIAHTPPLPTDIQTPVIPRLTPSGTTEKAIWDLVIISDSSLIGVGQAYASFIEEDLDIEARLHDLWRGGFRAVDLLYRLKTWEDWRAMIREAEVVVYFANPIGSDTGDWDCLEPAYYVRDCSLETFDGYQMTLEAIAAEILHLRNGEPTILRATDIYTPLMDPWEEYDVMDECMQCFVNVNEAVHNAANLYNIPVANVFQTFNGLNHDEDPLDKGYIGFDEIHTNETGQKVIADLLRGLGYDPVPP